MIVSRAVLLLAARNQALRAIDRGRTRRVGLAPSERREVIGAFRHLAGCSQSGCKSLIEQG